jgi:predicted NAD-dependent protein-ADP-ribosyltransferase YbiA (DUF1768 family)
MAFRYVDETFVNGRRQHLNPPQQRFSATGEEGYTFQGHMDAFSNLAHTPFDFDGHTFQYVDHGNFYYKFKHCGWVHGMEMALKTTNLQVLRRLSDDCDYLFPELAASYSVRQKGGPKNENAPERLILQGLVRAKFIRYPQLRRWLVATGRARLVEATPGWVWGGGYYPDFVTAENLLERVDTANLFGRMLEELRDEFNLEDAAARRVQL